MNNFTASNGIELRIAADLSGQKYLSGTVPNEHGPVGFTPTLHATASEEGMAALREFFKAKQDESVGRWRWPENPDYVVYPQPDEIFERMFGPGLDLVILRESDGMTKGYVRAEDQGGPPLAHRVDHMLAARAYFDAHPEPKPWHDAKPGEVWALTLEGKDPAAFYPSKSLDRYFAPVMPNTGATTVAFDWPGIIAGRRVWPEVAS